MFALNTQSDCEHKRCEGTLQGYAFVPEGDEEALKEAVYSRGPTAVSIDASHRSFRFYSHGKHVVIVLSCGHLVEHFTMHYIGLTLAPLLFLGT